MSGGGCRSEPLEHSLKAHSGRKKRELTWKRLRITVLWSLIILCYFRGIRAYGEIGRENSYAVFLSSFYPDAERAEEILEGEKERELPADVCFYWDGGFQTALQKEYGRREEVLVAGLFGNAEDYDWRAGGFAEKDRDGCLIDEGTSVKLFGSAAPGGEVMLGDKKYTVRKVLPWKQKVMVIRPENSEIRCTRVFVRKNFGRRSEADVPQFLMRNGLTGTVGSWEGMKTAAFSSLLLLPAAMALGLVQQMVQEKRRLKRKDTAYNPLSYRFMAVACIAAVVFLLWLIRQNVRIPGDWIPGRWSDFVFWQKKISTEWERIKLYLMLPKTIYQTEQLAAGFKTIWHGMLSLALFYAGSFGNRENAKKGTAFP